MASDTKIDDRNEERPGVCPVLLGWTSTRDNFRAHSCMNQHAENAHWGIWARPGVMDFQAISCI